MRVSLLPSDSRTSQRWPAHAEALHERKRSDAGAARMDLRTWRKGEPRRRSNGCPIDGGIDHDAPLRADIPCAPSALVRSRPGRLLPRRHRALSPASMVNLTPDRPHSCVYRGHHLGTNSAYHQLDLVGHSFRRFGHVPTAAGVDPSSVQFPISSRPLRHHVSISANCAGNAHAWSRMRRTVPTLSLARATAERFRAGASPTRST